MSSPPCPSWANLAFYGRPPNEKQFPNAEKFLKAYTDQRTGFRRGRRPRGYVPPPRPWRRGLATRWYPC
ncbi:hypothetical protein FTUN_4600 [Frigoriglobus tundricola]|uniref:Uncharacterized protein n=1 Tax=Frigoriglobus tundricola TaxID=2774151 RepID=A0A6M5YSI7_9BACT|nr:hypothetical protein FTUN_4600 [Frigoriglobus tundricola]